jgi:hypothetical protein
LTNSRTPTSHVIATNLALGLSILFQAAAGMVLRASGASAANFQQLLHSDLGAVGVNTHSQIDAHIADLAQHRLINDSGTSTIELFSASKVLALIAGVRSNCRNTYFKGGYDAATNTPRCSSCWSNSTRLDVCSYSCWYLTEDVEAGDLIISKQNAPTTLAHYTVVNKNIPAILPATTVAGIITLATQAEVNAE